MDGEQSNGRKGKAEDGEGSPAPKAACPCLYDCQKDTHQLTGNLVNLTLFEMGVTVQADGNHTLHSGVVGLLLRVLDAGPSTWHITLLNAKGVLEQKHPLQDPPVRIRTICDSLSEDLAWLDEDLGLLQSYSIKAPGQSTETWGAQLDVYELACAIDRLCVFYDWSDEWPEGREMRLSRAVQDLTEIKNLEIDALNPGNAWCQLTNDGVFRYCDKAAAALRTQLLRVLALYERHDDYLQFLKQIAKDLKTTLDKCDSKITSGKT